MKPTLRDIAQSQQEVLEELALLRDRVSKIEGICEHCAVVHANESNIVKAVRRENGNEVRIILTFLAKHWKAIATGAGFALLWMKSHGSGVSSDQIKRLQDAVDFLQSTW